MTLALILPPRIEWKKMITFRAVCTFETAITTDNVGRFVEAESTVTLKPGRCLVRLRKLLLLKKFSHHIFRVVRRLRIWKLYHCYKIQDLSSVVEVFFQFV